MDWLVSLFTSTDSVVHIALLYALVISVGIYLGRLKVAGISLGVTFVLFAGIVAGHFHFTGTPAVLTFMQDFGLILFVYCIGLQVGPGFFESFKKGGVQLNILAVSVVALNILVMLACFFIFFEPTKFNLAMMVGTLCGAITNTPGLGAATEALTQVFPADQIPAIASGYACAYPLGVVGIILSTIAIRFLCRVNLKQEEAQIEQERSENPHAKPHRMTLCVQNKYLDGKTILQLRDFLGREYVCTRLLHDGHVIIPNRETIVHLEDKLHIVCAEDDAEAVIAFIGPEEQIEWEEQDVPLVSRNILVTQPSMNGKTFGSLHFSSVYGVNVTRILRADMELFADRNLRMQVGDKIVVVGPEDAVDRVAKKMGNSVKRLAHPNLEILFIGIVVGLIFGALPISIPGMPIPVKLGLAGGPLCVAILLGRWGYKVKLVTYMSTSANLLLREVGLVLFLASVGIKAGASFVSTVVEGDGLMYVGCGFLITVLPILIVGVVGRLKYKINYFTLMGVIAGSTTDPPALAFANQTAGNDAPAVGYSTVYPLTMFLRILTGQVIILMLCALL
ncbi:MAG: putative transporter [Bacteroidaceae bacterium]|nr:putative transporter [Bacteroidaceae bacterium]MCF0183209.1 putative transporter [Bacteroidaceae bacterium]